MKRNRRIENSYLVVDANGMVRKSTEVVAGENVMALEKILSLKAHNGFSRRLTKNIHATVPVIEGVIVRAGQNEDGEIFIYGQKFYTEGNNCPNARALMEYDKENEGKEDSYRKVLKANGFVTRDARSKERKKYGLKAARRAPQFSKR
mgnify:CR=1 FL=1